MTVIRNAFAVVLVATPMFLLQTDLNAQGAGIACTSEQCRTMLAACWFTNITAREGCANLARIPAQGAYDICVNIRSNDQDGLTKEDVEVCERERDRAWTSFMEGCMVKPDKELADCLAAHEKMCGGGEGMSPYN